MYKKTLIIISDSLTLCELIVIFAQVLSKMHNIIMGARDTTDVIPCPNKAMADNMVNNIR